MLYKRDEISEERRTQIERKQFEQLPDWALQQYHQWEKELNEIDNGVPDLDGKRHIQRLQDQATTVEDVIIKWWDLAGMFTGTIPGKERATNKPPVVDSYVKLVCTYVNQQRAAHELAEEVLRAAESGERSKRRNAPKESTQGLRRSDRNRNKCRSKSPRHREQLRPQDYRVREEGNGTMFPGLQRRVPTTTSNRSSSSCKMITAKQYERICAPLDSNFNEQEVINVLAEIGCDVPTFQSLDYLFIVADDGLHSELVGVAPKQKFIFAIDTIPSSSINVPKNFYRWPLLGLVAIMNYLIPDIVLAKHNQIPTPNASFWPIFGQWPTRSQTKDKSPDGPQQSDMYNCGAFVVTNVFCLAFGYRLLCYAQGKYGNDLERWKKPRVVWELYQGGFKGDFVYELLDIEPLKVDVPVIGALLEESEPEPNYLESYPGQESPNSRSKTAGPRKSSLCDSNLDSDGDEEMAYNIPDNDDDHKYQDAEGKDTGYDTDLGSEGSDGGADPDHDPGADRDIDESRRFYTASEALMHEKTRVKPLPDTLQYPSQFGPRFQRAGFLYPIPEVNYQPGLDYSKAELKKACRDFPLVGWKRVSKQSKGFFLRWMLNEMGAMMSLIHGDPVKPMAGLARSYPAWKRQHDFTTGEQIRRDAVAIINASNHSETALDRSAADKYTESRGGDEGFVDDLGAGGTPSNHSDDSGYAD